MVNNDDIAVYINIGAIEQKDSVGKNALYLLCANDRVVMYTAVFVLCPPEDKVLVIMAYVMFNNHILGGARFNIMFPAYFKKPILFRMTLL